jgi:hypothetical protein
MPDRHRRAGVMHNGHSEQQEKRILDTRSSMAWLSRPRFICTKSNIPIQSFDAAMPAFRHFMIFTQNAEKNRFQINISPALTAVHVGFMPKLTGIGLSSSHRRTPGVESPPRNADLFHFFIFIPKK